MMNERYAETFTSVEKLKEIFVVVVPEDSMFKHNAPIKDLIKPDCKYVKRRNRK